MQIDATLLADLRGNPDASAVWQDIRVNGANAPTWVYSDAARASGAQGILYSSRSRPDLTHVVLFDLSVVSSVGQAIPFPHFP